MAPLTTEGSYFVMSEYPYSTLIPYWADDLPLYEYRLYAHYLRLYGFGANVPLTEPVRDTARTVRMSAAMVVKTRKALETRGIIPPLVVVPGWVYVINSKVGLYKIGMTTTSPEIRAARIASMSPVPVELSISIACDNPYALEQRLHKQFASKRVHHEWFALDMDDYDVIVGIFIEEGKRSK